MNKDLEARIGEIKKDIINLKRLTNLMEKNNDVLECVDKINKEVE